MESANRVRLRHDVVARNKGPALARSEERRQHPDHCRFAGPVWPEKAEHLSRINTQVDAGDGDYRAEAAHQAFGDDVLGET